MIEPPNTSHHAGEVKPDRTISGLLMRNRITSRMKTNDVTGSTKIPNTQHAITNAIRIDAPTRLGAPLCDHAHRAEITHNSRITGLYASTQRASPERDA